MAVHLEPNMIIEAITTMVFMNSTAPIRLINGSSSSEGRLELFYNGTWGTVCGSKFDDREVNVVCRMLGYRKGVAQYMAAFGQGSGPIWSSHLNCKGNETSIFDCPTYLDYPIGSPSSYCDHNDDVAVSCQGKFGFHNNVI